VLLAQGENEILCVLRSCRQARRGRSRPGKRSTLGEGELNATIYPDSTFLG
jgi:hypothetical protein